MRAHKTHCPVCKRTIKAGKPCPLAPHLRLSTGRLVRPIRRNGEVIRAQSLDQFVALAFPASDK